MPLLNYYSQTKMAKGEALGYKTAILHFAPYDLSGKNVCPKATKGPGGCIKPCLNTSGRGQMTSVQQARINKTNYFWNNKNGFLWELSKEIQTLKVRAANAGFKFAVRLNLIGFGFDTGRILNRIFDNAVWNISTAKCV